MPRADLHRHGRGSVMPANAWRRGELAPYVRAALSGPTLREQGLIRPGAVTGMGEQHTGGTRDWGEPIWVRFVLDTRTRMALGRSPKRSDRLEVLR